jgi:hypothetical protein
MYLLQLANLAIDRLYIRELLTQTLGERTDFKLIHDEGNRKGRSIASAHGIYLIRHKADWEKMPLIFFLAGISIVQAYSLREH